MKKILIEGWRGINHSYAMVNQYQLCELSKFSDLSLYHRDLKFANPRWNATDNNPTFPAPMTAIIQSIPTPKADEHFDTVLRIASPYDITQSRANKVLTFITVEYGLCPEGYFPDPQPQLELFTQGKHRVITPSSWSKMKLVEYGFPAERITIVPHGVSTDIFYPMTLDERNTVRQAIGLLPEHFVFLNLGAMTVNKGIDLLLLAFFEIHKRHPQARLVLKDDRKLYGLSGADVVREAMRNHPQLLTQDFMDAIKMLSVTLPLFEMRHLYGMADVYTSPYRAEGFNLPVIESIACGTPVIVTGGGATDDFCEPRTAKMISAKRVDVLKQGLIGTGYSLDTSLEELIQAMQDEITSPRAGTDEFNAGRLALCQQYSWSKVASQLHSLF
jgi:glycosyltransferase involved in cell wall biosynthesis